MAQIKESNYKEYEVHVMSKYSNGKYGKEFYFGMYLWGYSKKDAEDVAIEMIGDMTFDELFERCNDNKLKNRLSQTMILEEHAKIYGENASIGYELASVMFTCKAYTK